MKRRVVWSRVGSADFADIVGYLNKESPSAARRVAGALLAAAKGLGEHATGRPGRVGGTYEKVVRSLPYIIAYSVDGDASSERIVILRVIHGARDWPEGAWPG